MPKLALTGVVYFDQQTGAPYAIRWLKNKFFALNWIEIIYMLFTLNLLIIMHFFSFSFLFPLVMEKDEKTSFNAETNDFDQQTACEAPIRWSKYIL